MPKPIAQHDQYVCLASGLELGLPQSTLPLEMLQKFMRGETSKFEQNFAQKVVRVILAGNCTVLPDNTDTIWKGSYGAADVNQACYSKISEVLDSMEMNLEKLCKVVNVDVMPGDLELTTAFLPQQPLSKCMFPCIEHPPNLVSNPYDCQINGIHFFGSSGQNIKDMRAYCDGYQNKPIECLE